MPFRKIFFLFVLGLWAVSARAEEAQTPLRLSLQDCLELALKNNAKLPLRDYAIDAAQQRYQETNVRFHPVIDYSDRMAPAPRNASNAAGSFFEGDLTFLNATHVGVGFPIYAFGQIDKTQQMAQKGLEISQKERVKDETTINFDVQQLYNGILLSKELQTVAQDAIGKIADQLKKEETTHQHSPYDLLRLKVFKIDLSKRLIEAEEREKEARLALKIQIGLPKESVFELADAHLEPVQKKIKPLEEYLNAAQTERAESHLVDLGAQLKRLEYELEKKKLLPRLGFGSFFEVARTTDSISNLKQTDDFNNPFNYMRAGLGIELKGQIDFHGSSAKIKRLESEYQKTLLEGNLAKQGIQLEVESSYYDAKRFQETMNLAGEKQKMAHQMMFLSKTNMDIGVGEEKDYSEALQLVLVSEGEYLKAVYDYNIAIAKLDQKAGRRYEASAQ